MDELLIPILGILMPLVLIPMIMVLRYRGRKREWEHAERMKALELGLPAPGNESWPARVCIAIGAGVPVGSFFFAWVASLESGHGEPFWEAATMVGGLGVLCGTFLATRLLPSRSRAQDPAARSNPYAKSALDPDVYDVVGRRG
jgi:hypothetical protein